MREVGLFAVDAREVGVAKKRALKAGPGQPGAHQHGLAEIGPFALGMAKVGAFEQGAPEAGAAQVQPGQVGGGQVHVGEVAASGEDRVDLHTQHGGAVRGQRIDGGLVLRGAAVEREQAALAGHGHLAHRIDLARGHGRGAGRRGDAFESAQDGCAVDAGRPLELGAVVLAHQLAGVEAYLHRFLGVGVGLALEALALDGALRALVADIAIGLVHEVGQLAQARHSGERLGKPAVVEMPRLVSRRDGLLLQFLAGLPAALAHVVRTSAVSAVPIWSSHGPMASSGRSSSSRNM